MREFQYAVTKWFLECFEGERGKNLRNYRFFEEATELVQSLGMTKSECIQLIDYVFDRPVGEPLDELGGTLTTLAALCYVNDLRMQDGADEGIKTIWLKFHKIRAKWKTQVKGSCIPGQGYANNQPPGRPEGNS
jgi:hypothetical protein